jgi:Leucine-rich repeat (LRR) protein
LGVFESVSLLEKLVLRNNRLTLLGFIHTISLSNLLELDLNGNYIRSLSTNEFVSLTSLQKLDLSNNFLEFLPPNLFTGPSSTLTNLIIVNNRLQIVRKRYFVNMSRLMRLSLHQNYISSIEPRSFSDLIRLTNLDLSHNSLTKLDSSCFHNMVMLSKLNLSSNDIQELRPGLFEPLVGLVSIDLSFNRIKILHDNTFFVSVYQRLLSIDLCGNQIDLIETDAFSSLRSLSFLNLGSNFLIKSLNRSLRNCQLFELDLSNNKLLGPVNWEANLLSFRQVRVLNLENTNQALVNSFHFDSMTDLSSLNLNRNQIPENLDLSKLKSLTGLKIGGIIKSGFKLVPSINRIKSNLNHLDLSENTQLDLAGLISPGENGTSAILARHASDLIELTLSNVGLEEELGVWFSNVSACSKLVRLDLSRNHLRIIRRDDFASSLDLLWLNLSRNQIEILEDRSFIGQIRLTSLDLSFNCLKSLSETHFAFLLVMIKLVDLSNNTQLSSVPHKLTLKMPNIGVFSCTACNFTELPYFDLIVSRKYQI